MKRALLAIILACCTLTLAAQDDGFKVNYKGDRPTISDFAWTYLSAMTDDEFAEEGEVDESFNAIYDAWVKHRDGKKLDPEETLTIDTKNGFVLYEWKYEEDLLRIEMCYWNESDGKHKLFAMGTYCFQDGKYSAGQFDGLVLFRYDNATKMMSWAEDPGFDVEYVTDDGAWVSYDLPRSGKNITVNYWYDNGNKKTQKILKFDGRRFSF